jgi:hypothetical protein
VNGKEGVSASSRGTPYRALKLLDERV